MFYNLLQTYRCLQQKTPTLQYNNIQRYKENTVKYESECISLYIAMLKSGRFFSQTPGLGSQRITPTSSYDGYMEPNMGRLK